MLNRVYMPCQLLNRSQIFYGSVKSTIFVSYLRANRKFLCNCIWMHKFHHKDSHFQATIERFSNLDFLQQLLTLLHPTDNRIRVPIVILANVRFWQLLYTYAYPMGTNGDVPIGVFVNFHFVPHIYKHLHPTDNHANGPIVTTLSYHSLPLPCKY